MRGQQLDEIPEVYSEVIRVVKNKPNKYDNTERVLLVDADSIVYTSVYSPDRYMKSVVDEESGERIKVPMTEDEILNIPQEVIDLDIEECKFRFRTKIQEIQNIIEESFNIKKTILCCGGQNNFRYRLLKEYKANRKTTLPYLKEIKQYIIDELGAYPALCGEADDTLYHFWKLSPNNVLIATIDKDIKSSCYGLFYNYRSYNDVIGEFYTVLEEESRYNLCMQIITGDPGDNVNLCPKKGKKYAEKVLILGSTNYQYKKVLLQTYIDAWKGDIKLAKEKLRLCYKVLKLHSFKDIEKINLVK